MNLGQLLHEAEVSRPRKTALICNQQSVTYEELDGAARGIARRLLADGLAPGALVGVHSGNSVEAVKLILACMHAGLAALPVNMRLKAPELAYIMEHSGAAAWYSQPELATQAEAARASVPSAPPIWTTLPEPQPWGELPDLGETRSPPSCTPPGRLRGRRA